MKYFLLALALVLETAAADTNSFIEAWLGAQSSVKTWSAEFTQTRRIKTLREPLQTPGRLVFRAPGEFRWELGRPVQTVAVRNREGLSILYPKLRRVERYAATGAGNEPWRDALALMDAGFPESRAELEKRFVIAGWSATNSLAVVTLEPRNAQARRFISEIRLELRTNDFSMTANQLRFADGSTLRNDFTNAVRNPDIEASLFAVAAPEGFTTAEPLKK